MQNIAVFRLFSTSAQYVRTKSGKYVHFFYLGPIRTNESERATKFTKVANDFVGSIWMQTYIFHFKSDQTVNDPNKVLLGVKKYDLSEITSSYPT